MFQQMQSNNMSFEKQIYISTKKTTSTFDSNGNEIITYNTPVKYNFNVQPLSGQVDVLEFGVNIGQMQRAVIDYDTYFGDFKEGDKAYLDGKTPTGEPRIGEFANYIIHSVRNQNKKIILIFKRLTGK